MEKGENGGGGGEDRDQESEAKRKRDRKELKRAKELVLESMEAISALIFVCADCFDGEDSLHVEKLTS